MKQEQRLCRTNSSQSVPTVIFQSSFGAEITVDALISIVGEADKIYVRIDQNKAYWLKGEETGAIDIW